MTSAHVAMRRPGKFTNAALFTLKCGRRLADDSYQKAQVALTFNFACQHDSCSQMLSQHEVETLFHEFGHALNSLLSRTEFQHMSGDSSSLAKYVAAVVCFSSAPCSALLLHYHIACACRTALQIKIPECRHEVWSIPPCMCADTRTTQCITLMTAISM